MHLNALDRILIEMTTKFLLSKCEYYLENI